VNQEAFQTLLSPAGQEAIQAALAMEPRESDFLGHFTTLSRIFSPDLARAALETAILRKEGSVKFPFSDRMYFTRSALEQATNYEISNYRATRYRGFERILDLGCSIGGDTLTLAIVAPTIGVDKDPLRLAMARANLRALDLTHRADFVHADLTSNMCFSHHAGLAQFFDPSRRFREKRAFSVHDYQPPLNIIQTWLATRPALGVKISPGVRLEEIRLYDAEVEFISLRGELKEAVLWFGPLKTTQRRATLLRGSSKAGDETIHTMTSQTGQSNQRPLPLSEPLMYLYEPDPSILRAGLVQDFGEQLGAFQLDPDIAYLTSRVPIDTPFARLWRVESWHPFGEKRLRSLLRQRGVGRVVVKKRGSPLQPEALIHALRLEKKIDPDQAERILILTHLRGDPIVVICFPRDK
jgi:SAM-dependent methyltransferase